MINASHNQRQRLHNYFHENGRNVRATFDSVMRILGMKIYIDCCWSALSSPNKLQTVAISFFFLFSHSLSRFDIEMCVENP